VNGHNYLVADFNLECGDAQWNKYLPLACLCLLLYPIGIPAVMFYLLRSNRHRLKQQDTILSLGFLYEAYRLSLWWFELADMCNKLFLTSLLAFFPSSTQAPVGMGCAALYFLCLVLADPYVRRVDDRINLLAQCQLTLILTLGWLLQNVTFEVGSAIDIIASVVLFLVLSVLVFVLGLHAFIFIRTWWRARQRLKMLQDHALSMTPNPLSPGGGRSTNGASVTDNGGNVNDDGIEGKSRLSGSSDSESNVGRQLLITFSPSNRSVSSVSLSPIQRRMSAKSDVELTVPRIGHDLPAAVTDVSNLSSPESLPNALVALGTEIAQLSVSFNPQLQSQQ